MGPVKCSRVEAEYIKCITVKKLKFIPMGVSGPCQELRILAVLGSMRSTARKPGSFSPWTATHRSLSAKVNRALLSLVRSHPGG